MIGPALYPETGTSLLFHILVDHMRSADVSVHVIPIPRGGRCAITKLFRFLGVLIKLVCLAYRVDVISVHVPTPQLSNVAWAASIISRVYGRSFIVRKFGGMDPGHLRRIARALALQTIEHSDVCFVEARGLREDMRKRLSTEIFWFPNHRVLPESPLPWSPQMGRFVYIGRVRNEKGIREIVKAAASLGGRCTVDIYGPCDDIVGEAVLDRCPHVRYRGIMAHSDVLVALPSYNALLLPSYWPGEGYPGVIVEAFMAGVPVIATRWQFIGEMVDETCGMLVAPRDALGLAKAMDWLSSDEELTKQLHNGALAKAREFGSARWAELFIRACYITRENSGDRSQAWRRIRDMYQSSSEMSSDLAGSYCL